MPRKRVLIIGGGAAGYFAAITAAEQSSDLEIVIAEAGKKPLQKVEISGGGRCNVTHACFDIRQLVEAYPRGHKELRGIFSRFQPRDTMEWFSARGVTLKTEEDGRVFPTSDSSRTIIDCLEKTRIRLGVDLRLATKVVDLSLEKSGKFKAIFYNLKKSHSSLFDAVVITTGSGAKGYKIARSLGHSIQPCVPSLFTFKIDDPRLFGIAGVSVPFAKIQLSVDKSKPLVETGPLLVTHWGLSGPGVIKLSAWAARGLAESDYRGKLKISWCPNESETVFLTELENHRKNSPRKQICKLPAASIPKRLWANLCQAAKIEENTPYAEMGREQVRRLAVELFTGEYQISGKGVFKEEFVTCGGVELKEVDLRRMESKLVENLFFAGEILDVDGITGGYNFQNAWSGGFIAGCSISS